ncbi:MAG: tetratricopeptide repeat protein [Planctomycetia bacterium]|nr:tetratricopeptide repeat protein [Planctomycetia bacterium]
MTLPQAQPPTPREGRWRRRIVLLLLILGLLGAGAWRYRITRPEYRLARGQEAIRAKNTEQVRKYADKLEDSGYPDHAHLLRGEALLAFGSPGHALAQFNKIKSEGPIRLRAAALSGRCLLELGNLKEAHRVFVFVVSEQPDNVDGHRGLAAVAYDLGQLDEAVNHLQRVAELDLRDSRPHRLIGLIYKDMAQDVQSENAYREALRRGLSADAEREVRLELAEVLTRQGKFADALGVLDGGEPNSAEEPGRIAVRAECLRGLNRQPEAANLLDSALAKHQTVALYRLRGQVYQDQTLSADALKCFERAVEVGPTDHQAHYLLAQAFAAAGRKDDAARTFARVEELRKNLDRITELTKEAMQKPWDATVRLQLADLCNSMGKPELARMWRKAAEACSQPDP